MKMTMRRSRFPSKSRTKTLTLLQETAILPHKETSRTTFVAQPSRPWDWSEPMIKSSLWEEIKLEFHRNLSVSIRVTLLKIKAMRSMQVVIL